jgi:hypothetical protein
MARPSTGKARRGATRRPAQLKTTSNDRSVAVFLKRVPDAHQRQDAMALATLMREVTGAEPKMWGTSLVGYGTYHYKYESGREGDWFLTGFSPRKQSLTVYIMPGLDKYGPLLRRLGKHTTGRSCIYIKRLADVDLDTLKELVQESVTTLKQMSSQRGR